MNIPTVLRTFIALRQLHEHDHWSRQQLLDYQNHKLRELRDFAYQYSPFYRRFHKGLFNAPLSQLPILSKSMVMENFDACVTDQAIRLEDVRASLKANVDTAYRERYWIISTSGSSGKPGLFLYSKAEWRAVMTSFARGQNLAGVPMSPFSSHRFAFVLSPTSQHMTHRVGRNMNSPWTRLLYMSALEPIDRIVQHLNSWQPEILGSYASMVGLLAREQLERRLHVHPRWVFTSGEVLTPEVSQLIRRAWGTHPFNDYAATETAVIGAECQQHSGLHAYEDLLIVENVDDHNQPVPAGSYGTKLLVTVLSKWAQPLIRYELNDSVLMTEEPCACGRPFARILSIQGRQEENLSLLSMSGGMIPVHSVVFHTVMDRMDVGSWQIIQRTDGLHVLVTGLKGEADEMELQRALRTALEKAGACTPTLHIERVERIAQGASGKTTLIKSEIESDTSFSETVVSTQQ